MSFPVIVEGRTLHITRHAVMRWQERVRPGLGYQDVLTEMRRVLPLGRIVDECPEWCNERQRDDSPPKCWLIPIEGICCPVGDRGLVITVLDRHGMSDEWRERRQEARKSKVVDGPRKQHGRLRLSERARKDKRQRKYPGGVFE